MLQPLIVNLAEEFGLGRVRVSRCNSRLGRRPTAANTVCKNLLWRRFLLMDVIRDFRWLTELITPSLLLHFRSSAAEQRPQQLTLPPLNDDATTDDLSVWLSVWKSFVLHRPVCRSLVFHSNSGQQALLMWPLNAVTVSMTHCFWVTKFWVCRSSGKTNTKNSSGRWQISM